jgi:peptidoglycan/xylan/chitin deacetylase (PgdA/CDA1 family)
MIPILMYHKVGAPVSSKADTFLNVSTAAFRRQMRLLRKLGYQGITFQHAVDGLVSGASLPPRPVCVTFDDGYVNVGENAASILAGYGWPGTVFVPTDYVGGENSWDRSYGKPILPIMSWPQLQSLHDAAWEIAGHTASHPHLDELDDAKALEEMVSGKKVIEQHLGTVVKTFCYPFGGINDRTAGLVRQAGFSGACTTKSGLARPGADPFLYPRVKVAYRDGVLGFLYRLVIRPRLGRL